MIKLIKRFNKYMSKPSNKYDINHDNLRDPIFYVNGDICTILCTKNGKNISMTGPINELYTILNK